MRASVIFGAERVELGDGVPTIPAGSVVIEIDDIASAAGIRLDGRPLHVAYDAARQRASVAVDLARYTGFHQLIVPPSHRLLFGTEDAKLRIEGVARMLDYLQDAGLSWRGALHFSGTDRVLRDLRLDAAWLEANVPRICELAEAIASRPATSARSTYRRARAGVPALARTFALLRRERELIEEHPKGPIVVAGHRWAPREIVIRHREPVTETIGNRRATRLLVYAIGLASAVEQAMSPDRATAFRPLLENLERCLVLEPFRTLHRRRRYRALAAVASGEELFDPRYSEVWDLVRALEDERHWSPQQEVLPEYAYTTYADQVYQAFAATVLADALCMRAVRALGGTGPHFADARYDLYVNTTPPETILANWRDQTERPTPLRPDIVIHDRQTGEVIVADAKYRNDGDRASADSLNEAQLYLQAYGISAAAVVFPPASDPPEWHEAEVAASGYTLLEFPVRPSSGLREWLAEAGRDALFGLFR